jgi:hypothetical protein
MVVLEAYFIKGEKWANNITYFLGKMLLALASTINLDFG